MNLEHAVQMPGEIEDDGLVAGLAADARPGPASEDWKVEIPTGRQGFLDVVGARRPVQRSPGAPRVR